MTPTLSDLLERVRSASGPDRELDWDIQQALFGIEQTDFHGTPRHTASVDAALALVERLLPGWRISVYGNHMTGAKGGHGWRVQLLSPEKAKPDALGYRWPATVAECFHAPTAPLAILAALLTALQAPQPQWRIRMSKISDERLEIANALEEFAMIDEAEGGNPMVIATERRAAELLRTKGLPDNLFSHRESWLKAFDRLIELEPESAEPDMDEKGYWRHERQAMLDMYADLSTLSNAPQQEVFDDRDALISAVTEEQYRHGETGLELETMAAHNAVLIKALEAVAADVVGIGNGENAISDASRLLVESALTSPPPVDPAPSQDGVVTDAMRAALAVYGKWCVDIATLGELADLETRMSAVGISLQQMGEWTDLEAALNKGGE